MIQSSSTFPNTYLFPSHIKLLTQSMIFLTIFLLLLHFSSHAHSNIDIDVGYKVTLPVPIGSYNSGFIGTAFLIETNQLLPNFRLSLSVEPFQNRYTCSLNIFLGDVKVWSSGHLSPFFTTEKCIVELAEDGDLHLQGQENRIGWRTGTSGQGVKRLMLLKTGNLVLVDGLNVLRWQSFNFPTNIMVWGHMLNVQTRLTSFIINSTSFYSFEIRRDKLALYLNSGKWKYSYWEFKPSKNRNMSFTGLSTYGLQIFDDKYKKVAQILTQNGPQPLRFLALENRTGNLGLYHFSPQKGKFEASFQVLTTTCEIPLACKPYGICTITDSCSCIQILKGGDHGFIPDCKNGVSGSFCDGKQVEMVELDGVSSVLKGENKKYNISRKDCAALCIDDCECVAAVYSAVENGECNLYGQVIGVTQKRRGRGMDYMIKVEKGKKKKKSWSFKKWVLVVVGVSDGFIIFIVLAGFFYYLVRKYFVNNS